MRLLTAFSLLLIAACGQDPASPPGQAITVTSDAAADAGGKDAVEPTGPIIDNSYACRVISQEAARVTRDAVAGVPQCEIDADCVPFEVTARCWPSCFTSSLAGNDTARRAVRTANYPVSALCESARQLGCSVGSYECQNTKVASTFRCDQHRCVPTDETTCQGLSNQAVKLLVDAAESVVQCAQDADCTPLPFDVPCADSCGFDEAGSQATHDAVKAAAGQIAAICARFSKSGCTVVASGCPGFPQLARVCQSGRCTRRYP